MPTEIIPLGTLQKYINDKSILLSLTPEQIYELNRKINSYADNSIIKSNLGKPILFFFDGEGGSSPDPTISLYNPARYRW